MKKTNNLPSWKGVAAVGTLSTALIAIIQSGKYEFSVDDVKLYTSLSPALCTVVVSVVNWGLAIFNVKSPEEIRSERVLNKRIKSLQKEIIKGRELGINISKIEKKYQDVVLAKDNLYEQSVNAILTGE